MWDRNGVYWAKFRRDGKLIQKKLSKDFRVAGELLRDLQVKADRGELGNGNKAQLSDIRDRWLAYCGQTLRESTVKRYRENIVTILPRLSCTIVKQLNVETITCYRAGRMEDEETIPSQGKPGVNDG